MLQRRRKRPEGLTDEVRSWYLELFLGNEDATELADQIFSFTHIWDDLIDKDREVSPEEIHSAFYTATIEIWRNPFFLAHHEELSVLLEQGIQDWWASIELEKEGHYPAAFVLRGSILSIMTRSAYLIGGLEHGRRAALEMLRTNFDDFDDYVREHDGLEQ